MEDFFYRFDSPIVIQASGEDAEDYLQSQWTIDLRKLKIGYVRYGLRLSAKGKILAGAYIARIKEEDFLLITFTTTAIEIIKLMEENVVADEVEFQDVSEEWKIFGLHLKNSGILASKFDLTAIEDEKIIKFEDGMFMADKKMPSDFYLALCPKDSDWEKEFEDRLEEISKRQHKFLRIKLSNYFVSAEVGLDDLPQEAGMEKNFVDFNKGCYLGQEVMARLHSMGKVQTKILTVLWKSDNDSQPNLPSDIIMDQKTVGQLRTLVNNGDSWLGVAKVHLKAKERLEKEGLYLEDKSMGKIFGYER